MNIIKRTLSCSVMKDSIDILSLSQQLFHCNITNGIYTNVITFIYSIGD